ncbi:MAG: D-alanyl-D-alanine carboxypeptidase [Oscillospiraceae bacterium]|nr:D-alanyl-D-alanine carboxypeptidase [Oscillospiraceae bacterium]
MKKRLIRTAAALVAAAALLPCRVQAISAQKAILMDAETGRVIYEKDAYSRSLIASTTKIMTALVVCEQCNVLDRVRIPKEAVGIEGSSIYLKEGEILTVQELLYGMMLHSGNDAAVALAIYCGGTVEGFVQLMNDKAYRLGLTGTHFENPNGLDSPNHYSTARDLAVLTAAAMQNPIFAQTVSTKSVRIGERSLQNHNKLLWRIDGADGVKTGYTRAAGRILVSSVRRDGRRLICVTINDGNDWADHQLLLEDAFRRYENRVIVRAGDILGQRSVLSGDADTVQLVAAEDFSFALTAQEQPRILLSGSEFDYAPVVRGADAGYAYILLDEKPIGKVRLIYSETVEQIRQQEKIPFWKRLLGGAL